MKMLFIFAVSTALAVFGYANSVPTGGVKRVRMKDGKVIATKVDRELIKKAMYIKTGGKVARPGTYQGRLVYVNCQKSAPVEWLQSNAAAFAKSAKIKVNVETGDFSWPSPRVVGNASLFIVDDAKLPSVIVAPENRWGMVNLAPLKSGDGQKEAYFAARVQKELSRSAAILCGSHDSNYPNPLTACMTDPSQLDKVVECALPVDVLTRISKYVVGYGIIPAKEVTYEKAVKEGWAPQPTNDVQKAIWDNIHSIPDKPMKIKFDPAVQKGKVTK